MDQKRRDFDHQISAAIGHGDVHLLLQLAAEDHPVWYDSPQLLSRVAQGLSYLDRNDDAMHALDECSARFPSAVLPKQVRAIALLLKKEWQEAQRIIGPLIEAGQENAETLYLHGWIWSERYKQTHDPIFLERSRDAYGRAFERHPDHFYPGFNAAMKSAMLADLESARALAHAVEVLLRNEPHKGFWMAGAFAIVRLIQGFVDEATDLFRQAVVRNSSQVALHKDTLDDVRRLYDPLELSEEQRNAIERAFDHRRLSI
jgi:predicted Zn-dependent protease